MEKGKIDSSINIEEKITRLDLQPNSLLIVRSPNKSEFQFQKLVKVLREKYKFEGVVILMPEAGTIEQIGVHQLEEIIKKLKGEQI